MNFNDDLTLERLKQLLSYDPDTGVFTWIVGRSHQTPAGTIAGSIRRGYVVICVDKSYYRAHRLAWLYVYGKWPDTELDHINRIRNDNRIANLRLASRTQNLVGRFRKNKFGLRGVEQRGKTFRSYIRVKGKNIYLGTFPTPIEAHEAFCVASQHYYGDYAYKSEDATQ